MPRLSVKTATSMKPGLRPNVAALFLEPLDPAEAAQGHQASLFRGHPAPDVLLGLHLEVEAQLAVHLPLRPFDLE